jgi:adenosylcobyric acid synthase
VLPGSKTTLSDLAWLRLRGIDERILALARSGTPVLGICGGFQMLGRELRDDAGSDGSIGAMPGLGLLPVRTAFGGRKRTALVRGRVVTPGFISDGSGLTFDAYEIHVGRTREDGAVEPFAELLPYGARRPALDGAVSPDGLVIGTYAHGLFVDRGLRNALLHALAARRGQAFIAADLPRDPYARASRWLRSALDVGDLLRRCGVERSAADLPDAAGDSSSRSSRGPLATSPTRAGD